jgi:hypothetical protein
MAKQKTLVTALQAFSHGNVDAKKDGVYAMNPADAKELEKAGFVSLDAKGDPEQTQADAQPQAKHAGDVVVDDADDVLGDGKAAQPMENKMEQPARNKTAAKK